jgi:hypothetical protein
VCDRESKKGLNAVYQDKTGGRMSRVSARNRRRVRRRSEKEGEGEKKRRRRKKKKMMMMIIIIIIIMDHDHDHKRAGIKDKGNKLEEEKCKHVKMG